MDDIQKIIREINRIYGMNPRECKLIRQNENKVYKLIDDDRQYVLRLHCAVDSMNLSALFGNMDECERINDEMVLLDFLSNKIEPIQIPVKTKKSQYISQLGDTYATILQWMDGESMNPIDMKEEKLIGIGDTLGKLHKALETAPKLYRYDYTCSLCQHVLSKLLSNDILENINDNQRSLMIRVVEQYGKKMDENLNRIQLIHADLGCSNFIQNDSQIGLIDFSLSGYGLIEFDLASVLLHFESLGDTRIIRKQYRQYHFFDAEIVQLCMAMQAVMYVVSGYEHIGKAPWFQEALSYWCEGLISCTVNGSAWEDMVQLYQA